MTKISFDPEQEEVEITRSIGKNGDGKITINREGGGAIEINLGVGKIGLTSDYGGAISLGIAGQEVTWGREGGTIHIGIGGFNVDVEARDCIVTEIKSIAGIVVAQRSYPDPGCEPPDPPEPPEPPDPPEPPKLPNDEIKVPDTDAFMWVICDLIEEYYRGVGYHAPYSVKLDGFILYTRTVTEKGVPTSGTKTPFELTETQSRYTTIHKITKDNLSKFRSEFIILKSGATATAKAVISDKMAANSGERYQSTTVSGGNYARSLCYFGSGKDIGKYIRYLYIKKEEILEEIMASGYPTTVYTLRAKEIIPLIPTKNKPRPYLPTGNKPPMKDCCEEILDYLADFEEAFDIQRLLKDKFPVSNTFMAPECDPASVTLAKSYYEIIQCAVRMMAHGLIFEPRVAIKDADAAKAGDQEFKARYLNATGWASAMAEALLEVKDDGNVSTNMDIRGGFAATQTMVGVADAIYRLEVILDCLGIELIPRVETVETPYNLQIQIGKGFGEGNERQIDLNTDEATEKLLPTLLQTKKNKIKTVDIHPRSRSIKEILENIEANLSGVHNKG